MYLGCFIAAFTVYSLNVTKSKVNYSDKTEIAIAELDKIPTKTLEKKDLK